jgi:hypothetical protein
MNAYKALSLSALTLGLVAFSGLARADEASTAPQPPPAPPASGAAAAPSATNTPAPRHRRPYSLPELTQKLGLSPEQQAKVGSIIDSAKSQAKAVRADTTLSKEDRRAKMVEIMRTARDQIRADLTLDQQAQFDTLPRPGGGQGAPPANPPAN